MFYSFDYLNVHYVSISTESDYPDAPIDLKEEEFFQTNWLEADLQQVLLF